MMSKDNNPVTDMIADFDHDDMDVETVALTVGPRKGTRKLLLSAVALAAVLGAGSYYTAGANAKDTLPQAITMSVADGEEAVVPPIDALAQLEDEILGGAFSAIEPTSGELPPQILGGSDETVPMPVPVEQTPPPGDMPPPPETQEIVVVPPSAVPAPDPAVLASPEAAVIPPPPSELTETVSGGSSTAKLTPEPKSDGPDNYYDSSLNVPTGPLADTVGPRKVDPVLEPASKLIISKKTADKGDIEAQVIAANRALDLERYESALEMFNQLYERNPRDVRILMGRAVAQQRLGMDDVAIMSYEALLDVAPGNTDAIVNMMGLIKKQYPAVALRRLTDLRDRFPGNAGIAAQLGMTYAQMGDNQQALQSLGTASSLEPNNAQHVYNMAVVADRAGSKVMAVQYYEQSLQTDAVYGAGRSIPREKIYDRLSKLRQ
jgi:Flp pilus assembly protein TadD